MFYIDVAAAKIARIFVNTYGIIDRSTQSHATHEEIDEADGELSTQQARQVEQVIVSAVKLSLFKLKQIQCNNTKT